MSSAFGNEKEIKRLQSFSLFEVFAVGIEWDLGVWNSNWIGGLGFVSSIGIGIELENWLVKEYV